jgi:hypothetical protein
MAWFATKEEQAIAPRMEAWLEIVRDEIDGIEICRDKPDTNDWPIKTGNLKEMPDWFTALTTDLSAWISVHHPTLDPTPLHDLDEIIRNWHTDRNARQLPAQATVRAIYERAKLLVGSAHGAILARVKREAPAVSGDTGTSTHSSWNDETGRPALTPELIQQTANALLTAADGIETASAAADNLGVLRWTAHGACAALRLAEAGYSEFAIFMNAPKDCQTQFPFARQYRGRPAEWRGFHFAAIVLMRWALAWYPHKFPPGASISENGPVIHDLQIAYRAIADRLAKSQAETPAPSGQTLTDPAETGPHASGDSPGADQYVTLDQMAALVNRSKKTLERKANAPTSNMPAPDVEGGGGRPHEWKWPNVRPWLEKQFGRSLPASFPR